LNNIILTGLGSKLHKTLSNDNPAVSHQLASLFNFSRSSSHVLN